MEKYVRSTDGINIHYHMNGTHPTALLFVHGWLGNADWWDDQAAHFQTKYTVVRIDLPGHGKSESGRTEWSAEQYAKDIKSVADQVPCNNFILVGHSMSGPYTLEASLIIPRVKLVVLVDTVKDMDQLMDYRQADELLFQSYQKDFKNAVENFLPKFLFSHSTPAATRDRLHREFLNNDAAFAVATLAPLYKMDVRKTAQQVRVPVRAINSDYTPTNIDSIRKYLADYEVVTIAGTGHYPMLENPAAFNQALDGILTKFPA